MRFQNILRKFKRFRVFQAIQKDYEKFRRFQMILKDFKLLTKLTTKHLPESQHFYGIE